MTPRGPETTLSSGQPTPRDASDTRDVRLLLGVTLTSGVTLAFLGVVLLQIVVALAVPQTSRGGTEASPRPECHDGVDSECDEGQVCAAGRCVAAVRAQACQVGDACEVDGAVCTCEGELRCVEQKCVAPEIAPGTCHEPEVADLLKGIAETCDGDLGTCDADKLEKFAVDSTNFDAVMAKFPTTITVHFPDKSPPLTGGRKWPSGAQREYYRSRLGHPFVAAALAKAEDILLIGRSSEGGHEEENYQYSRLRVEVVRDLLMENVGSQSEHRALAGKLQKVLLSNRRVIEPDFFRKHFTNRLIAWSSDAEALLRVNIHEFETLRGRTRPWTNRIMNQVVFVVPLPCKLPRTEAKK